MGRGWGGAYTSVQFIMLGEDWGTFWHREWRLSGWCQDWVWRTSEACAKRRQFIVLGPENEHRN